MKFILKVPFEEKEIAKRRGARWDPIKKIWYVINPVRPELFMEWMTIPNYLWAPTKIIWYVINPVRPELFMEWMTIPNYLWAPTKSKPLKHKSHVVTAQRSKKKKIIDL